MTKKSVWKYPARALLGDYIKSLTGMAMMAAPLFLPELVGWLKPVFLTCLLLFLAFALRSFLRQNTYYVIEKKWLHQKGIWPKSLNLEKLEIVDIRYFSTRRNREAGWFQTKIVADGRKIIVDSSLNEFDSLVKKLIQIANEKQLFLNEVSCNNLRAILAPPKETR